jgi:carboxylesterase type B
MAFYLLILCFALAILARSSTCGDTPVVEVQNGRITGSQCQHSSSHAYLGIWYALPPVGPRRFAPPSLHDAKYSTDSLNATTPPPACVQFGTTFLDSGPKSEDCLFLNVWSPAGATPNSGLPVLSWIYGGSFLAGGVSNPLYDGCYLANDAIVVGANYRLRPLGFLYSPDAGIQGNMGLQDLLLGLNWVQDNIAAFGGDPRQVAVFGQSAGASMTWILSSLPPANSLMRAGIMQSGGGNVRSTQDEEIASWKNFSTRLNCSIADVSRSQSGN